MRAVVAAMAGLGMAISGGLALADPGKDESGKGRERGGYARYETGYPNQGYGEPRYDRGEDRGRRSEYDDDEPRRERRAGKEEYDDGVCKVERKWEANGDYKEERKCRGDRRANRDDAPRFGYRY